MQTLWKSEQLTVAEIVEGAAQGRLALPRFQRPFVWSKPAQLSFLCTVLRNLPSGALLVLQVDDLDVAFAPEPLEGAPSLSDAQPPERLLLDGQQRATTIFRAFSDCAGDDVFVLDLGSVLERGRFEDDDLRVDKSGSIPGSLAEQAQQGVVGLHHLIDAPKMSGWYLSYIAAHLENNQSRMGDLIEKTAEILPGSVSGGAHELPVITIKKGAPLAAVTNVFEGINRRGTRLGGFDLMVARLYRRMGDGSYFDLRDQWSEEVSKHDVLERFDLQVDRDGLLPLQLIALAVSRLPAGVRPAGVNGVKQSDILELPVEQVIGDGGPLPHVGLGSAMRALAEACSFLQAHCGVMERRLLPQDSMLVPLADRFLDESRSELSEADLKRWFFSSGLLHRYYGSVNSYIETDGRELRAWADQGGGLDGDAAPEAIRALSASSVEMLDLTASANREGRIIARTLMAMLVAQGALDWRPGQLALAGLGQRVEIHHMVPRKMLKRIVGRNGDDNPIGILTPISASRNGSYRDKNPADVVEELGADAAPIFTSHRVDDELLGGFSASRVKLVKLLEDRDRRLKDFVISSLGL